MKKEELKAALKPLIKECIKEVMFEDDVLSSVIKEVIKGTSSAQVVTEVKTEQKPAPAPERFGAGRPDPAKALAERKSKLLGAIGSEAFNGIDIFEGTAPLSKGAESSDGPHIPSVLGDDPADSGVDITGLFSSAGHTWKTISSGMKK